MTNKITRREFLKKFFAISAGALLIPSAVSATTLSEFKQGKRFKFDGNEVENPNKITKSDESIIGEEILSVEGFLIRETHLQFRRSLENRNKTDGIVIHHVGNTTKNINSQTIHRWHLHNGWNGIGYHYIIRKDGSIERGRPLNAIGAHCYKQNEHTVGICVVGNFELEKPTQAQFRSAEKLVGAVCGIYGIIPDEKSIVGHKYYNKTDCPGIYLQQWMPDIIRNSKKFC